MEKVLFEIDYAVSFLVSGIVTYVLIPGAAKDGKTEAFFKFLLVKLVFIIWYSIMLMFLSFV